MGLSDLRILKPSNSPHPQGRGIRRTQDWAAFMGPHQSLSSLFNSLSTDPQKSFSCLAAGQPGS